jgi:hypothetical protein
MTRRGRAVLTLTTLVGSALGLSACGGAGGQQLAQQACVHVHRSVAEWRQSLAAGLTTAQVTALRNKADRELLAAMPLAAAATSADGTWNSLQTAISENSTIDEGHLVPSLDAQCAVADTNVNVNPESPGG